MATQTRRDLKFNRFVFAVPAYRLDASKRQAWLNSIPQKNELLDTKKIAYEDRENVLHDVRSENHPYNDYVNLYFRLIARRLSVLFLLRGTHFYGMAKRNYRHKSSCHRIIFPTTGKSAETLVTRVRYYLFEEYWIADPGKYHFFRRKLNLTFLACPFILMGQRSICRFQLPRHEFNRLHVFTRGIT